MLAELTFNIPIPNFSELAWYHYVYAYMTLAFIRHLVDIKKYHNKLNKREVAQLDGPQLVLILLYNMSFRIPVFIVGKFIVCPLFSLLLLEWIPSKVSFWTNTHWWRVHIV
jgi:hypothetical protein